MYPQNKLAKQLLAIVGAKTFTNHHVDQLVAIGFSFTDIATV
jgi:hypothetical protein